MPSRPRILATIIRTQHGGGRWLILLTMLGIVALFWYLNFGRTPGSFGAFLDGVKTSIVTATSESETAATEDPASAPGKPEKPGAPAVNDRILTCTAPDGSTFYTNALRCEDADLDNRVTELPAQQPRVERAVVGECLDPRVPHQFRPVCAEPFRAALELEADLAAAADPMDVPELDEYCDLIAQGVHAGCPANSAVFCYLPWCQQRASRPRDP